MNFLLRFLLISFLVKLCWSRTAAKEDLNTQVPRALVLIGRTENKSFFVEKRIGNWTVAKNFCESMGMRLASIETQDEIDVLMNAEPEDPKVFHGWHWTSARDARTASQLVWDTTNSSIPDAMSWVSGLDDFLPEREFLTCGVFLVREDIRGMAFQDCSLTNGHVLCEQSEV